MPSVPAPGPFTVQVELVDGPTSVWPAPVALIARTFVKESVSGPATEPVAPLTVHVDAGATTSTVLVAVAPPS